MSNVKKLVLSIVQFLGGELRSGNLSTDAQESLEVAIQCLESAYGVSANSPEPSLAASRPLLDIFTSVEQPKHASSEQAKTEAEKLKNEGNNLMKANRFKEALDCYTDAINLDGNNSIYFCNRAAAFSKLNDHKRAIDDCQAAIVIDPTYSKAYGRMGLAYASLEAHQKAKECYEKAVQLDPDNESYVNNLKVAEEKLRELSAGGHPQGGGPNFGNAMDLGSLFSNPALVNMATHLMQDPNMQNLMTGLMSSSLTPGGRGTGDAGGGGGGGGEAAGAPPGAGTGGAGGMDALLQAGQQLAAQLQAANPDLVEQLRQQMNRPNNPDQGNA